MVVAMRAQELPVYDGPVTDTIDFVRLFKVGCPCSAFRAPICILKLFARIMKSRYAGCVAIRLRRRKGRHHFLQSVTDGKRSLVSRLFVFGSFQQNCDGYQNQLHVAHFLMGA